MESKKSATLQIPLSESMNSELYQCVSSGDYNTFISLINSNPSLLLQTTIQKNTLLHVAAAFNQKSIAEEITNRHPPILYATNSKEDTALHLAARLGSFQAAEHLIERAEKCRAGDDLEADDYRDKELLRMVNLEKDTALHDAVRNGHGEIAKLLVKECPELVTFVNGVGESPLFVAVEEDYLEIAQEILRVDLNCLYGGRDGANVLHAIIIRTLKRYTQNLIETPLRVYLALPVLYVNHFLPQVLGLPYWERKITCKLRPSQKDLIQKVLNKFPNILIEPDIYGWLPLHYAAYLGSKELVELILNHKPSMAYEKDKNGVSALHLAAKEGRSAVLKTFARLCPDSCELLDSKDQTVLHVAVANRQAYAVRKMLELRSFRNLVNQKDIDGNTPLHVAAIVGDYVIIMMLASHGRVDKKIMNKAGFTTNDIIRLNPKFSWYEKSFSIARLEFNGALRGMEQVLARKSKSYNPLLEKEEPKPNVTEQEINRAIVLNNNKGSNQLQKSQIWSELSDANLVVATIIATVTFSAAFQVPGGYQSDGMAVLRKEKYFRLYLLSDALSFGFAAASMFVTFFTGLFGANSGFSYPRRWVTFLTGISVWFMVFAFMLGTSAVMAEHSGFAGLARSVACVSFIWPVVFLGAVAVNWFTYFP
ncbi:protein ACCELERATED CELL DEATH 6-like [Cucumis melo var. makuwa]|uniref:Protein ACCELERATED CELL DEATH 6-like n=1 Tax=Cucumis melo var. makuwa TaxID=1194695 RepID=A0A5A7V9E4_CUCMM|nr:protein ACCELERATED CELL DEATH 6-like [Cucumis melo var. makuwa]TYK18440.1 protein ACCELERATED CELL DEATH 6-like [Cucumis melo var. makuwa]